MRLFSDDIYWMRIRDGNEAAFALFTRHYSFRKRRRCEGLNGKRIAGTGETILLLGKNHDALFIWRKQKFSLAGQTGINCSVFHNESRVLSSELIQQAEDIALKRWPGERLFTYINPYLVKSENPGYCFKVNGWKKCGLSKKRKLIILEKI